MKLPHPAKKTRTQPWLLIAIVLAIELALLSITYTNNFTYTCRAVAPATVCEFYSRAVERAILFLGVLLILFLARPALHQQLLERTGEIASRPVRSARSVWLAVQMAGVALILMPWLFAADGATPAMQLLAFPFWVAGAGFAIGGAALYLAPLERWWHLAKSMGPVSYLFLGLAIIAPELARAARGAWQIEPLTNATFQMVVATLNLFGVEATARPQDLVLVSGKFAVAIGWQCSGVEGFGLTTIFVLCYFYAFAKDLRFPHAWVLLPIALVLSWLLNILRIAALFAIGKYFSRTLAANGFHSHAGWLMFSILALSVIWISRSVPWFRREHVALPSALPLRQDWVAARILPFAAFMISALLLSTFTVVPDLWYVVKVVFMAVALAVFIPLYRSRTWTVSPVAIAIGMVIGLLWLLADVAPIAPSPLQTALAALPLWLLAVWVALRLFGTIFLVPVVEELFFRGYVLDRIDKGGHAMRIVALAVSTAMFAALHGRWFLAAIAGLAFGLLYLWKRRLSDAVVAHMASNAVIAAYAVAMSNWAVI